MMMHAAGDSGRTRVVASPSTGADRSGARARIAVVGINGYGARHVRDLAGERVTGAELVAVVEPLPPRPEIAELIGAIPRFASLEELLAQGPPDIVVLATPIPTHVPLATAAMRAGCHVLVEKPPAASFAEFDALLEVTLETGRSCQVGFQSLGSNVYDEAVAIIDAGEIGEVSGIGAVGTWLRRSDYWERAPWAGRRALEGVDVVDGVVTNPLAHAVVTSLRIDGATTAQDVASVEVDLYRANDIESDDTSAVVVTTAKGTSLGFGLTLCAPIQSTPRITVYGTAGKLMYDYFSDELQVDGREGVRNIRCDRTSLLRNLADHVADPTVSLKSPLADSGAFMRVVEAVRTSPVPQKIDPALVEWREDGLGRHPVVKDVEAWCARVAAEQRTFSALGAPWSG